MTTLDLTFRIAGDLLATLVLSPFSAQQPSEALHATRSLRTRREGWSYVANQSLVLSSTESAQGIVLLHFARGDGRYARKDEIQLIAGLGFVKTLVPSCERSKIDPLLQVCHRSVAMGIAIAADGIEWSARQLLYQEQSEKLE